MELFHGEKSIKGLKGKCYGFYFEKGFFSLLFTMFLICGYDREFAQAKPGNSYSEEGEDKDSKDFSRAVNDAQDLLNDPKRKSELFKTDNGARDADSHVKSLTGGDSELDGEIYQISSQVLGTLSKEAGNDPEKLKKLVEKMQRDPQSLEKYLSSSEKSRIKGVAEKIETNQLKKISGKGSSYKNP